MKLDIFVIGFGRPDLLREQVRLINKFCTDDYGVTLVDNTPGDSAEAMRVTCEDLRIGYLRAPSRENLHPEALNFAALHVTRHPSDFWSVWDHDIFPRREFSLIERIKPAGFFGIGQFHHPTQSHYLWPGYASFSKEWLNGRVPNFNGIRGVDKRDDGDCGSMLHSLFTPEEWLLMPRAEHGYGVIRPEDSYGLQSWGYEYFDAIVHLSNASRWMAIPDPDERDRLLMEMIQCL